MKVGYLIEHASAPRLLIPKSAKGGGKNRAEKKRETYPLPITVALAMKLKQAAAGRAEDDSCCCAPTGMPWNERDVHADYRERIRRDREGAWAERKITAYCFRHSRIVRQLLRGVPTRVVAANHNTSVRDDRSAPIRSTSSTIPIS